MALVVCRWKHDSAQWIFCWYCASACRSCAATRFVLVECVLRSAFPAVFTLLCRYCADSVWRWWSAVGSTIRRSGFFVGTALVLAVRARRLALCLLSVCCVLPFQPFSPCCAGIVRILYGAGGLPLEARFGAVDFLLVLR